MWVVVWLVITGHPGHFAMKRLESVEGFANQRACKAYLALREVDMPETLRSVFKVEPEDELAVKGTCWIPRSRRA